MSLIPGGVCSSAAINAKESLYPARGDSGADHASPHRVTSAFGGVGLF